MPRIEVFLQPAAFLSHKMQKHDPETASPNLGVEKAINQFLLYNSDFSEAVDAFNYSFNAFVASEDFELLDPGDRGEHSMRHQALITFLHELQLITLKSDYRITPNGVVEGNGR